MRPRIDSVTLTYFRRGKCEREGCVGREVERTKSFTATSELHAERYAQRWMTTPLMHKRCEELS